MTAPRDEGGGTVRDVTCHPDRGMAWTCIAEGCGAVLCNYCDGIDNGSGLCWSCFGAEPDGAA